MEEKVRKALKERINMTDEDIDRLWPGIQKLESRMEEIVDKWKIVAECTSSKYCSAGIKVGDKFAFKGYVLIPEECTATLCLSALSPILGRLYIIFERLIEGLDPNGLCLASAHCGDTGVEHGGSGRVTFKVYAERIK